jgi:membrane protein DedA with SNARE-associated domain
MHATAAIVLATGTSHPLPGFLSVVQGPLEHYGIWAIALLLLLENIGVPVVPGELAMIAGAILAGSGELNVVEVGVTCVIVSFVGSFIGYLIGWLGGRALVVRYGRYIFIREHHLDRTERAVDRYGGLIVILARYIVGLRELNGIIAGVTSMRPHVFGIFNAIGAVAWVATWVSLGYLAGDHIAAIYADVSRYALYVAIVAVVAAALWIGLHLRKKARRRSMPAADPEDESEHAAR